MNIHEELFVKSFIVPQKRERYLEFLGKKSFRHKITWNIEWCEDLIESYKTQIPISKQNAEDIYKLLKEKNAPNDCYAISSYDEIDEKILNLRETIEEHFFDNGTFVSCIPGTLIYYASEEIKGCFVLENND